MDKKVEKEFTKIHRCALKINFKQKQGVETP